MANPNQTSRESANGEYIRAEHVTLAYGGRTVLEDMTVSFRKSEVTVIMGRSGCGKSTLLKALAGLLIPKSGRILIDGKDINTLPTRELDLLRLRWGMLFQNAALLNSLTVGENIALPLQEHTSLHPNAIDIVVEMELSMVGLEGCKDLMPEELSGGMRKRAGLARAMVMDPELLFLDEPVTGLDPIIGAGIDELIVRLKKAFNVTMIVVSHDVQSAMRIADRIVMIGDSNVLTHGTVDEIRNSPIDEVQRFLEGRSDQDDREFTFELDRVDVRSAVNQLGKMETGQ